MKRGTVGNALSLGRWLAAEVVSTAGDRLTLRVWNSHTERCDGYPASIAQMPKDRFIAITHGIGATRR